MTASLAELGAGQLAGDAAFVHHERAVGQADDFFHLAGREQDGDALAGQLVHEFIDFFLRADIDAARRLVEQQQLRREAEPLAEHDLLLVAAGKIAHGHAIAGRLDAHAVDHVGGDAVLGGRIEEAAQRVRGADRAASWRATDSA